MPVIDPKNLGPKVSTRNISWLDLCERAWGSEFRAPDHGVYEFKNGKKYDSTDIGKTGLYGVIGDQNIVAFDARYPDLRDGFLQSFGPGQPNGALNLPIGSYDELVLTNSPLPYPFAAAPTGPETDPYFANVVLLVHNTLKDSSLNNLTVIGNSGNQLLTPVTNAPIFIGDQNALSSPNGGSTTAITSNANDPVLNLWDQPNATLAPFTVEFSVYFTTMPAGSHHFTMVNGQYPADTTFGANGLYNLFTNQLGNLQANKWYQLALTYDGKYTGSNQGRIYGFINGKMIGIFTDSNGTIGAGTNNMSFFNFYFSGYAKPTGYIKEIRITKGIQRYGADYIPRTIPFPNQ